MSISVKVVRIPGTVKEVELNEGATVDNALAAAELNLDSGEVANVNGTASSGDTQLSDGDKVIIAKGAKGNK